MISTDNFYRSLIRFDLLKLAQKTGHSTDETLIFLTMQKITFTHPVTNAQCHANVRLTFFIHPVYFLILYISSMPEYNIVLCRHA